MELFFLFLKYIYLKEKKYNLYFIEIKYKKKYINKYLFFWYLYKLYYKIIPIL